MTETKPEGTAMKWDGVEGNWLRSEIYFPPFKGGYYVRQSALDDSWAAGVCIEGTYRLINKALRHPTKEAAMQACEDHRLAMAKALVAEVGLQLERHRWVSVEERLPEIKDASVLVYFGKFESVEMVHTREFFAQITAGRGPNDRQLYTEWHKSQNVTHWMPLPDPPAEARDEVKAACEGDSVSMWAEQTETMHPGRADRKEVG